MTRRIEAVLFDFDGTLTEPGVLDFAAIRRAVGCPDGVSILEHIDGLGAEDDRRAAREVLDRFEMEAAARARPNQGAEALVADLLARGLPVGVLTRNTARAVHRALENFERVRMEDFACLLTREHVAPPKPEPHGVLHAAEEMGVSAEHLLMVGDFRYDVEAGARAGALTAYLTNRAPARALDTAPTWTIETLDDLRPLVRRYAPLRQGKLPNDLLAECLAFLRTDDPSLLVPPGVGEDIAAALLEGAEVAVLKADPITFATDAAGQYAVFVNANDVATSGARPRWLLATLLFPPGTNAEEVQALVADLGRAASQAGLTLCGGHTEVTDAVRRPVISGALLGTVQRSGLIDKRALAKGDRILFTKGVAVEGTAIIAREFGARLAHLGFSRQEIDRCRDFLYEPGISVLREARAAAASAGVSAMHDVTEGGLSTALEELSVAGGQRLLVELDRIPILPETERVCAALGLDPLGLIGSGSLLIACRPDAADGLERAIHDQGVAVAQVATANGPGQGVAAVRGPDRTPAPWPHFDTDELTRLY